MITPCTSILLCVILRYLHAETNYILADDHSLILNGGSICIPMRKVLAEMCNSIIINRLHFPLITPLIAISAEVSPYHGWLCYTCLLWLSYAWRKPAWCMISGVLGDLFVVYRVLLQIIWLAWFCLGVFCPVYVLLEYYYVHNIKNKNKNGPDDKMIR